MPIQSSIGDDSSVDGSDLMGRSSPRVYTTSGDFFQTEPYPVSPTAVSIEPLSLHAPQSHLVPPMQPYPIINTIVAVDSQYIQGNQVQVPFTFMSTANRSQADEILDQAVNELFNDANNIVDYDQEEEFNQMWDHSEFGIDSHEDDLELGFMLDKLLEQ